MRGWNGGECSSFGPLETDIEKKCESTTKKKIWCWCWSDIPLGSDITKWYQAHRFDGYLSVCESHTGSKGGKTESFARRFGDTLIEKQQSFVRVNGQHFRFHFECHSIEELSMWLIIMDHFDWMDERFQRFLKIIWVGSRLSGRSLWSSINQRDERYFNPVHSIHSSAKLIFEWTKQLAIFSLFKLHVLLSSGLSHLPLIQLQTPEKFHVWRSKVVFDVTEGGATEVSNVKQSICNHAILKFWN